MKGDDILEAVNFDDNVNKIEIEVFPEFISKDNIIAYSFEVKNLFVLALCRESNLDNLNQNLLQVLKETYPQDNFILKIGEYKKEFNDRSLVSWIELNSLLEDKPIKFLTYDFSLYNELMKCISSFMFKGTVGIDGTVNLNLPFVSTQKLCISFPMESLSDFSISKVYLIEAHEDGTFKVGETLKSILAEDEENQYLYKIILKIEEILCELQKTRNTNLDAFPLARLTKEKIDMSLNSIKRKAIGVIIADEQDIFSGFELARLLYTANLNSKEKFATPKYDYDRFSLSFLNYLKLFKVLDDSDTLNELIKKIDNKEIDADIINHSNMIPLKAFIENYNQFFIGNYSFVKDNFEEEYRNDIYKKLDYWKYIFIIANNFNNFVKYIDKLSYSDDGYQWDTINVNYLGRNTLFKKSYKPRGIK